MRSAALLVVAGVLAIPLAGCGTSDRRSPGAEICRALNGSLGAAVTGSTKLPSVEGVDPMVPGSCSTKATARMKLHVPGVVDEDTEVTTAGRVMVDPGGADTFHRYRDSFHGARGDTVTPLPQLGPGAFVVTTEKARAGARRDPSNANPGDGDPVAGPAAELPLPATAYWLRGRLVFRVSATREGASVAESQRITTRLAELVNRFPADEDGGGVYLASPRPGETTTSP